MNLKQLFLPLLLAAGLQAAPVLAEQTSPALKISYALSIPVEEEQQAQVDLWNRVRAGFRMAESDAALTRVHEQWYASHPAYMERAVERSRRYLYFIVDEVEKRGMPMEIALLPIIESAYNPQAESPMKASGIWQFIPSTGRVFGLKQNAWFDGRRDVLSATRAALDYLENLYGMFGDWELALAAYNCGEGCVQRAQAKRGGKSVDYASLKLPTETRHYVPKLIAVRNIVLNPQRYGLSLGEVANEPYFMQVTLSQPMEARLAARLADMDIEEFLSLNPGFQRRVIHTDSHDVLLLPTDRVETFQFNLHKQGVDKSSLRLYQAKRGETVGKIAALFGVTVDWLKEHNPLNVHQGKIAQTQTLLVPAKQAAASAPAAKPVAATVKRPAMRTHTVKQGDTLARLAKRYRVNIADIRRWNEDAEPLKPGSKLEIPISS